MNWVTSKKKNTTSLCLIATPTDLRYSQEGARDKSLFNPSKGYRLTKPLTDESGHKPQSTENFIDAINTKRIPDGHKLVSFDVKSLFTSIPLQLAPDYTDNAIKNSTVKLPLPTDDIMDLLNFCLTSTYFQYNGKHCKQLHGTAMDSSVSAVSEEIVMQNIKEQALAATYRWLSCNLGRQITMVK